MRKCPQCQEEWHDVEYAFQSLTDICRFCESEKQPVLDESFIVESSGQVSLQNLVEENKLLESEVLHPLPPHSTGTGKRPIDLPDIVHRVRTVLTSVLPLDAISTPILYYTTLVGTCGVESFYVELAADLVRRFRSVDGIQRMFADVPAVFCALVAIIIWHCELYPYMSAMEMCSRVQQIVSVPTFSCITTWNQLFYHAVVLSDNRLTDASHHSFRSLRWTWLKNALAPADETQSFPDPSILHPATIPGMLMRDYRVFLFMASGAALARVMVGADLPIPLTLEPFSNPQPSPPLTMWPAPPISTVHVAVTLTSASSGASETVQLPAIPPASDAELSQCARASGLNVPLLLTAPASALSSQRPNSNRKRKSTSSSKPPSGRRKSSCPHWRTRYPARPPHEREERKRVQEQELAVAAARLGQVQQQQRRTGHDI
jgi:hypothetical protein